MKRILVVEDNENNLYLMKFILEKNGYTVIVANTGEEGVKMALSEIPDLVLMDIQLPGINGLEATQQIRSVKRGEGIPIVAITSYALLGDREQVLKAGCNGYIEKPIDPETVMDEICKYLKKM